MCSCSTEICIARRAWDDAEDVPVAMAMEVMSQVQHHVFLAAADGLEKTSSSG